MKYFYFLITVVSMFFKTGPKGIYLPSAEHLTPLWARGRQLLRDVTLQQSIIQSAINKDSILHDQIAVHIRHDEPALVLASMIEGKVFVNVYKPLHASESLNHRPIYDPFWKDCGIFRFTQYATATDGVSHTFRPATANDGVYFDYYSPVISYVVKGNQEVEVQGDVQHACWVV